MSFTRRFTKPRAVLAAVLGGHRHRYRLVEPSERHLNTSVHHAHSDNFDYLERIRYFQDVNLEMAIDSMGSDKTLKTLFKGMSDKPVKAPDDDDFICRYKFIIVAENYYCNGYATEKLWRPYLCKGGSVPVIHGARDNLKFTPANDSYVYTGDYATPKALAKDLLAIADDPERYARFFDWKRRPLSELNPAFQKLYLHLNAGNMAQQHRHHKQQKVRGAGGHQCDVLSESTLDAAKRACEAHWGPLLSWDWNLRPNMFQLMLSSNPTVDDTHEPIGPIFNDYGPGAWTPERLSSPTMSFTRRFTKPRAVLASVMGNHMLRVLGASGPDESYIDSNAHHAHADNFYYLERVRYFGAVNEFMTIDNMGLAKTLFKGMSDKPANTYDEDFICRYKFIIVAENYYCNGYATEKLWRPYLCKGGSVPVIHGARDNLKFTPANDSYVYTGDYATPKALAKDLLAIADDPERYARFFDWKRRPLSELNPAFQKLYLHLNARNIAQQHDHGRQQKVRGAGGHQCDVLSGQPKPDHWCRVAARVRHMQATESTLDAAKRACEAHSASDPDYLERVRYFGAVNEFMTIDDMGSDKTVFKGMSDKPADTYDEDFICRYKFIIVAENFQCNGYATEKLWRPYLCKGGSVPVIHGARDNLKFTPANDSYVYTGDYATPKALAKDLLAIADDPERYARFFDWKRRPLSELNPAFQKLYLHLNAGNIAQQHDHGRQQKVRGAGGHQCDVLSGQPKPDHWCRVAARVRHMQATGHRPRLGIWDCGGVDEDDRDDMVIGKHDTWPPEGNRVPVRPARSKSVERREDDDETD
eukprot:g2146.t1